MPVDLYPIQSFYACCSEYLLHEFPYNLELAHSQLMNENLRFAAVVYLLLVNIIIKYRQTM